MTGIGSGMLQPSDRGALHFHDRTVAMPERSHALNGVSPVVMPRGLVRRESGQRDIEPVSALK